MKQISILGCGWLGLPLAKYLVQKGNTVKGSTTSSDKLELLKSLGILPFSINITAEEITGSTDDFLENSEILIINIPPKLRAEEKENFVSKIQLLIPYIEKSTISKVIFVSSTSVYADDNEVVTEDSFHEPATESGRQLFATESILKNNSSFQTTVIRFGGLIGEDRNPIRFLAGRKNLENPEAPINLIHLEDCIGIIASIIEQDCWDQTFNAVTPFHPSRKKYYSQKAVAMNLDLPEFNSSSVSNGKTISSAKVQEVLNYSFKINPL
jgi:nucleoside-diphosphate-sugar epimerase